MQLRLGASFLFLVTLASYAAANTGLPSDIDPETSYDLPDYETPPSYAEALTVALREAQNPPPVPPKLPTLSRGRSMRRLPLNPPSPTLEEPMQSTSRWVQEQSEYFPRQRAAERKLLQDDTALGYALPDGPLSAGSLEEQQAGRAILEDIVDSQRDTDGSDATRSAVMSKLVPTIQKWSDDILVLLKAERIGAISSPMVQDTMLGRCLNMADAFASAKSQLAPKDHYMVDLLQQHYMVGACEAYRV